MSCVLRIGGEQLDVDALMGSIGLPAYRVDRKGAPRLPRSHGPFEVSMVHLDVSASAFWDLQAQVADAIAFLTANADVLATALRFPGVDRAILDFAVEAKDLPVDSKYLPPDLLRRAGELGLGIELSSYPRAPDDDA